MPCLGGLSEPLFMVKTLAFPIFPRDLVNQPCGCGSASDFPDAPPWVFCILLYLGSPPFCSTVPCVSVITELSEAICWCWPPPVSYYCVSCGCFILSSLGRHLILDISPLQIIPLFWDASGVPESLLVIFFYTMIATSALGFLSPSQETIQSP